MMGYQEQPGAVKTKLGRTPRQLSKLDKEMLHRNLKQEFMRDAQHSAKWRKRAKENFEFAIGTGQWSNEEKAYLDKSGRAPITFNRTLPILKAVAGIEINGRHEVVFLPRGTEEGDVKANELLTGVSDWMSDGCDAENKQSQAFQDCEICAMGWVEQTLDYDEAWDGKYTERSIYPLEMYWDRDARDQNLADAKRIWHVRKMPLAEARELFPDAADFDLDAPWARWEADTEEAKAYEEKIKREENVEGELSGLAEVTIVRVQWKEKAPCWHVADPRTGQIIALDDEEFERLKERAMLVGMPVQAMRGRRWVYKQAFLGQRVLEIGDCPSEEGFTFQCMTGELDRTTGTWFSLVDTMKDPQKWANKWLTQTLHILNTTAKGGILAEKDAFDDQREAQETYAHPDAITFVRNKAVSEQKIMPKPGVGSFAPYVNLMEFAVSSIRDTSGINMEILGAREANQPGVLEAQRKQAAMTILATLFDSLKLFRRQNGRNRLCFIQNYMSDGRIARVSGPDGMKNVRLTKDKMIGEYDVIVDDAPTSPNQKQETWATLQLMLPVVGKMLTPQLWAAILRYSPLPSQLVEEVAKQISKPNPEAQAQKQIAQAGAMAQIEVDKSTAEKNRASAQSEIIDAAVDMANAQSEAQNRAIEVVTDRIRAMKEASGGEQRQAA